MEGDEDSDSGSDSDSDGDSSDDEDNEGEEKKKTGMSSTAAAAAAQLSTVVQPVQAHIVQVDATKPTSTTTVQPVQRGMGAITLSTVPRAYWTTLFHLEAIKARNKPTEAPKPPASAPFFLPTLNRQGDGQARTAPSFPSPKEYQKILQQQQHGEGLDGQKQTNAALAAAGKSQNSVEDGDSSDSGDSGAGNSGGMTAYDAKIMNELAQLGSVWSGGEEEEEEGDDEEQDEEDEEEGGRLKQHKHHHTSTAMITEHAAATSAADGIKFKNNSVILRRSMPSKNFQLPRCKLATVILQEFPTMQPTDKALHTTTSTSNSSTTEPPPILAYLMSIPPSAIDLEFSALCNTHTMANNINSNELDHEGIAYLHCLLQAFTSYFQSGSYFEILQAYLHRLIVTYRDFIIHIPELSHAVMRLRRVHQIYAEKFRHVVQSNLCLLQILSKMPIL